jgi:hypothetical protein
MSEAEEREVRQLIAQTLSAYRSRASTTGQFVQNLQALVMELRLAPSGWLTDFQAEVNSPEVLYAVALDRGVADDLPADYRADADETVDRLEALLTRLPPLLGDGVP